MLGRAAALLLIVLAGSIFAQLGIVSARTAHSTQALSVCDYASQLTPLLNQAADIDVDTNQPLSAQLDRLQANLSTLGQIISGLQQLMPPTGFEEFHTEMLNAFQLSQTTLQQLLSALQQGATPSVSWNDVVTPLYGFVLGLTDTFPAQASQLSACG